MKINKIATILWLYHTELAQEFINLLLPHKEYIDIFLGLCATQNNTTAESLFKESFRHNLTIDIFDNKGADILPTLYLLEKCNKHKYVFKLHSKKHQWGINKHVNWRTILLHSILYQNNFYLTLKQLKKSSIGMVGTKSFIVDNFEHTNTTKILEICQLLNIKYSMLKYKKFIGGNIFATKSEILQPFINNNKLKSLLSNEFGHVKDTTNGTYCHSIERLFGYMVEHNNKKIIGSCHPTHIILNPNVQQHRLHLIKLYNNDCYIEENPNIYGKIIFDTSKSLEIRWLNHKLNNNTIYIKSSKYLINKNYVKS